MRSVTLFRKRCLSASRCFTRLPWTHNTRSGLLAARHSSRSSPRVHLVVSDSPRDRPQRPPWGSPFPMVTKRRALTRRRPPGGIDPIAIFAGDAAGGFIPLVRFDDRARHVQKPGRPPVARDANRLFTPAVHARSVSAHSMRLSARSAPSHLSCRCCWTLSDSPIVKKNEQFIFHSGNNKGVGYGSIGGAR